MFGWCKPRKEFVSKLLDGQSYEFCENDICEFHDLGGLYSVSSGLYDVQFAEEMFYKKFKVIHRETECSEKDCFITIYSYKNMTDSINGSYLVCEFYLEKYYEWLNNLYDLRKIQHFMS